MNCSKCGCENIRVIQTYRNRVRRNSGWTAAKHDTREVICDDCGTRYWEESRLVAIISFDWSKLHRYDKQLDLWIDENAPLKLETEETKAVS